MSRLTVKKIETVEYTLPIHLAPLPARVFNSIESKKNVI